MDKAILMKNQLISLLNRGGFEAKKWASNDPAILSGLPPSYIQCKPLSFDLEKHNILKILGLKWNPSFDYFFYQFNCNSVKQEICTKRSMLSELGKLYDPTGYLTCTTLIATLLIQRLWALQIGWDEPPPAEVVEKWQTFKTELKCLCDVKILRHVDLRNMLSIDLVGFCDASEKAYCANIYFRVTYKSAETKTYLIIAKSKVAPLKTLSLPRLELCAAVLLAKLIAFVIATFKNKLTFSNILAFSDSTVSLNWIKGSPHVWKTFVGNRVAFIQ